MSAKLYTRSWAHALVTVRTVDRHRAGACTVLIVLAALFSPPGASPDVAISNRILGVLMVWITAVFLKFGRI